MWLQPSFSCSGKHLPAHFFDDGQSSPSLFRLLRGDIEDETCRARLWVEQHGDGGFWETKTTESLRLQQRQQLEEMEGRLQEMEEQLQPWQQDFKQRVEQRIELQQMERQQWEEEEEEEEEEDEEGWRIPVETFAGVTLSRTSDMPPWQMQDLSVGKTFSCGAPPAQSAGGVDEAAAAAAAQLLAAVSEDAEDLGSAAPSATAAAGEAGGVSAKAAQNELMLVFLKTLGLRGGETIPAGTAASALASTPSSPSVASPAAAAATAVAAEVAGNGRAPGRTGDRGAPAASRAADALPRYLTHAVLRGSSPLRSLFELAAELLRDGTTPEELCAHVETLPWAWQAAALKEEDGAAASQLPSGGATAGGDGARECRKRAACRRFFECPPAAAAPGMRGYRRGVSGAAAAAAGGSSGGGGGGRGGDGAERQHRDSRSPAAAAAALTLEEAGLSSGASVCFFRRGGEAAARMTYEGIVEGLVEGMRMLLRGEGPLGRVHLITASICALVESVVASACFLVPTLSSCRFFCLYPFCPRRGHAGHHCVVYRAISLLDFACPFQVRAVCRRDCGQTFMVLDRVSAPNLAAAQTSVCLLAHPRRVLLLLNFANSGNSWPKWWRFASLSGTRVSEPASPTTNRGTSIRGRPWSTCRKADIWPSSVTAGETRRTSRGELIEAVRGGGGGSSSNSFFSTTNHASLLLTHPMPLCGYSFSPVLPRNNPCRIPPSLQLFYIVQQPP